MAWFDTQGKENDVVVSSRIRFARNLAEYPFGDNMDDTSKKEVIEKVGNALGKEYEKTDFEKLSPLEVRSYSEKHYVSPMFAQKKGPRALFSDEKNGISIMVCEEDHIRLQCILPGLDLEKAFENACKCDDVLDSGLNIAFDTSLGYLTYCPTNLGTAMRASVMMFLPAMTLTHSIDNLSVQLSKLGFTIRGMYGEGSEPDGCMFQISNRITMGITEEDTVKKLNEVVVRLCERERKLREELKKENYYRLCDRIGRSYGILKNAYLISSSEFMRCFSDVRLGIALGMINDIDYGKLGEIMVGIMPSVLTLANGGKPLSESERDAKRAEYVRKMLA